MYQLPSSNNNEAVSVSCLDMVWSDMFETVDIKDRARQSEAEFLKGAPPQWMNFDTSVNSPMVKRNGFDELVQLVEKRKSKKSLVTDVSLRYQPSSGGSTLAMQVLWHFRKDLRCARVIDSDMDTEELSKQVVDLFLLSNIEGSKQDQKTVLLLLDTKKKINDLPVKDVLWENLIEEIHKRNVNSHTPVVIILNCIPEDFTLKDTLILDSKTEIHQFKEKLLQQVRLQRKSQWKVTSINLLFHKDSKGSEVAKDVMRDLSSEFTCKTLTNPFRKEEIAKDKYTFVGVEETAKNMLSIYGDHPTTVLLLLELDDDEPLHYFLKNMQSKLKPFNQTDRPAFIIISAVRKNVVQVPGDVKLKMELLPDEKEGFDQKMAELKKKHKKLFRNFHAFKIMQGGFQKEDAEKAITEKMKKHVEQNTKSSSTRLLSFLALVNSYVPGSHLLKLLCKKFIEQEEWPTDGKPEGISLLEARMKPFGDLIVTFSDGEQKSNCIRLAHPLIADACLNMLSEYQLTRSDIAQDFLKSMVKSNEINYVQICKSMLISRPVGLIEKEKFSKLILDLLGNNKTNKCQCLLEQASNLFSKDPFYPQALARLFYLAGNEENKYDKAEQWATEAIERDPKSSYIRDTLGQVHKNHLRYVCKKRREWGYSSTNINKIAKSAIEAFEEERQAAEDEPENRFGFNNRGHFGFLQVWNVIHEIKNTLEDHFINGYRADIESTYNFFEWYLAYSRLSFNKKDPDYIREDVEECYKRYFTEKDQDREMILTEKKMVFWKSFGGLLHFLKSDISVLKEEWNKLQDPQPDDETQNIVYILANIILSQCGEPCEETDQLQVRLQRLWVAKAQYRSPEFYLLTLLLFWSDEVRPGLTNPPNLEDCVQYMNQSYKKEYQKYLRSRYLVPLFFFGNGSGLVHTSKLKRGDLELLTQGDENAQVGCLKRVSGKVEDHKVFAVRDGQQIPINAHNRASVYTQGQVTFYLGFTIRGPVAYNIRYEICK